MNSKDGSKKLWIALSAALTVVILVLVLLLINSGRKDRLATTETTEVATEQATASDTEAEKTTEAATEKKASSDGISVSVKLGNTWENGGFTYGQFDATVTNNSGSTVKNWSIALTVPEGTKVDSGWNGDYKIEGTTLMIRPAEYNGEIAAGATVKDIGFIFAAKSMDDLRKMADTAMVLVDGQAVAAGSGKDEKKEEATTEEKKTEAKKAPKAEKGTPFENHGKLSVKGVDIVDKNGEKYQLKGLSTHGLAWFPEYVNKDAFSTFRDDWQANVIRLAMYTDENGGYCTDGNPEELKKLVKQGVDYATELGMYVIIDWHILHDLTPQKYKTESIAFFEEMSATYKDYDNVLYEICNEPNGGTSWSEVKSYAEEVIPVIRKNDKDAIIIIGTPTWSQDVDLAAEDPVDGENLVYTIHFYAATHTDNIRNKVETAIGKGIPVFVSEFSICDASGNGAIDYDQAALWFDLIDKYNLSYVGWNISNKDETSSILKSSCSKTSGWTADDLSESGTWLRKTMRGE